MRCAFSRHMQEFRVSWVEVGRSGRTVTLALLGEYEHTLDEKGRLTLPSRLRSYFEGGIVITKGVDRCLFAFPPDEWAAFKANIKANADLSSKVLQLSRMFFSLAFDAVMDR